VERVPTGGRHTFDFSIADVLNVQYSTRNFQCSSGRRIAANTPVLAHLTPDSFVVPIRTESLVQMFHREAHEVRSLRQLPLRVLRGEYYWDAFPTQ